MHHSTHAIGGHGKAVAILPFVLVVHTSRRFKLVEICKTVAVGDLNSCRAAANTVSQAHVSGDVTFPVRSTISRNICYLVGRALKSNMAARRKSLRVLEHAWNQV